MQNQYLDVLVHTKLSWMKLFANQKCQLINIPSLEMIDHNMETV